METTTYSKDTVFDTRFYHPSTILISGVSSSGKTSLTKRILENRTSLFKPDVPNYVVLIYVAERLQGNGR